MKLSSQLTQLYEEMCGACSYDVVACDEAGERCFSWEPQAVAWDTCGIVEKHFFNPETGKYSRGYDDVRQKLRESLAGLNDALDKHEDPYLQVHAQWWGAIWGALAEESKKK